MQIDGALIKEQGVTFAIVVVKSSVLNSKSTCDAARENFSSAFPGVPIVLMAQDFQGRPTYQGMQDLVNFLSRIHPSQIPWKRYTLN